MHLLVLPTPLHGGELHSLDVDGANRRLLSAGKDGSISVWALAKLTSLNNRRDIVEAAPDKTLRYHHDVVSIAKWCPTDTELFVSCDKSGNVYMVNLANNTTKLVYPMNNPPNVSNTSNPPNASTTSTTSNASNALNASNSSNVASNTSTSNTYNASGANVIDGSWSPDGKLFAWSTADGKVHIYDHAKTTYQELTKLNRIDKNLIQRSIAFDPSNHFLVTLGDDTLIYVYQFQYDPTTKNYQFRLIHKNSKLLNKTPLNVRYKRISWSPDGEYLSVPTAIKNQTSLVSLISRSESWANKVSLVGHDVNCEVVKFNPKIYSSATASPPPHQSDPSEQNRTSTKENSASNTEDNEGKPVSNTEGKPVSNTEDKSVSSADPKPVSNPDDKPASNPDDKPVSNAEDKPVSNAQDIPASNAEDKPVSNTQDRPIVNVENKSLSNAEDEPVSNAEAKHASIPEIKEHNTDTKVAKELEKKNPDQTNSESGSASNKDTGNVFNIIATAGSDRTLVVWNTSKDTPVFVIKDLVSKAILDLCWDKTGTVLFLAAADGSLAVVTFEPLELGTEIDTTLYNELKAFESESIKPFNHKYDTNQTSARRSADSQQIEILDQKDAVVVDSTTTSTSSNGKTNEDLPNHKDEKPAVKKNNSHISPVVPPAPSLDEAGSQFQDILQSTMSNRQAKSAKPAQTKQRVTPKTLNPTTDPSGTDSQKITTKNGKRRIQPMLISKSNDANGGASPSTSNGGGSLSKSSVQIGSSSSSSSKSLMEFDKPSYSVSEEVYKEKRRLKASQDDQSQKKFKRDLEPIKFIGSVVVNPSITFAKVRLAVPKVRLNFRTISKSSPSSDNPYVLDIRNGQGNETTPTRITFFKKDKQLWCDFVPRYIQLVSEGSEFWALSTADGQILTYSARSGKRILPPMIIGAPISFLESHGKFLMAITSVGELYVWNLEEKKIHLNSPSSLSPLLDLSNKFLDDGLSKSENLTMCSITSLGVPLVTLSNGSGYLFNKDMGTWQTITESWWAFGSHYWDSLGNDDKGSKPQALNVISGEEEGSIVGLLEHRTNEEILRKTRAGRGKYFNKISKNMIMKEGFENLENTISLSHLENRILCSELLGEFNDFKKFLITYAKRICELGLKAKLYEICNQLLGPISEPESEEDSDGDDNQEETTGPSWDPKVCGLDKRDLLKEIILVCASNRDAQRILIHFGKKLGILDDEIH